jgi:hypothetical protein
MLSRIALASPSSIVKLIIFGIRGHLTKALEWLPLRRSQSSSLSSVSVCRSCRFAPDCQWLYPSTKLVNQVNWQVRRSEEIPSFGQCLHVLNLVNDDQIALCRLNHSKSTSSRELIPLTCLHIIFGASHLIAPNWAVLIDPPSWCKAKKSSKHQVLAASIPSHVQKNRTKRYWTVQQHRNGTGHFSRRD